MRILLTFPIHAITAMENDLFKDFVRRLRENNVMDSVKNLKDMYMDFVGKYTLGFIVIVQLCWHFFNSTRASCFHLGWWTKVLFSLQQWWWFQCRIDDLGRCGWYGKAGTTRHRESDDGIYLHVSVFFSYFVYVWHWVKIHWFVIIVHWMFLARSIATSLCI